MSVVSVIMGVNPGSEILIVNTDLYSRSYIGRYIIWWLY